MNTYEQDTLYAASSHSTLGNYLPPLRLGVDAHVHMPLPRGQCGAEPEILKRLVRFFLLSLLPVIAQANPATDDTIRLLGGLAVQHDDNLFRLSSSADPKTVVGKSTPADDITISSITLKLSKHYSLQHVEAEASLSDHRYRTFSHLNFLAREYAAAWHWNLTPYLHGKLSSDRKQSLNSFTDYSGYGTRNLRTDENQRFDGVLEVGAAWRVLAGVTQTTRTNSELFNQEGDNRLISAEGGLRYDFRSGVSISAIARNGRGSYFNRTEPLRASLLDNRFDQEESQVRLLWPATGKLTFDINAGRIKRQHEHFGERDFAGPIGKVNVHWKITDKTSVSASLGHELSSYQSTTSSYISTDRLILSPSWQISEKTALRARYDYARRGFRGAVAASPVDNRVDTQRLATLSLEWQPLHDLAVNASLQSDTRTSNLPGYDYASKMASVSAQFAF